MCRWLGYSIHETMKSRMEYFLDVEVEDTILPETIIEEEQEATTVGAVEPAITTTQTPAQTATTDRPQVEFINRNASNDLAKSDGIVSFL